MLSPQFIEEMKQKLLEEKKRIETDLAGMSVHSEIGDDIESTEDEAEADFDKQGIRAQLTADLKKIDAALEKIEAGTYGTDDEGKEISEERLRVLPWADKAL